MLYVWLKQYLYCKATDGNQILRSSEILQITSV